LFWTWVPPFPNGPSGSSGVVAFFPFGFVAPPLLFYTGSRSPSVCRKRSPRDLAFFEFRIHPSWAATIFVYLWMGFPSRKFAFYDSVGFVKTQIAFALRQPPSLYSTGDGSFATLRRLCRSFRIPLCLSTTFFPLWLYCEAGSFRGFHPPTVVRS